MKVEIKSEGIRLKGGEVIFDKEEGEYYFMGRYYEQSNDNGEFRAINLNTGKIYGLYNWQSELDKNRISIVESKLLING